MKKSIITIAVTSLLSSLVLVLYFNLFPPSSLEKHVPHGTNEVLERNYDGPAYVAIAKTLYNKEELSDLNFNGLPAIYFATHFPVYPVIIKLFAPIFNGFYRSAIVVNWASSILVTVIFYLFLKKRRINQALWLALLSLFIPPRWLAVRSVGASEGIFMSFFIISVIFWEYKKYFSSAVALSFAILTRPPGILFYLGYQLIAFYRKLSIKSYFPLMIAPASLIILMTFFSIRFNDPIAYFHINTGTSRYLQFFPFSAVLGYNSPVAESFLYLYTLYAIGIYLLWKQKERNLSILCASYFISTLFILSDDISRYLIPISPFALIFAYRRVFSHKLFIVLFLVLLLGIYMYTIDLLPRRLFHYGDYVNLRMQN